MRVGARGFAMRPPFPTLYVIKCAFSLMFFWPRVYFCLRLVYADFFPKWHIRPSSPGPAVLACLRFLGPRKGRPWESISHLLCWGSLRGTHLHTYLGCQTHESPVSLADFISLCLNPNGTGTHFRCHQLIVSLALCILPNKAHDKPPVEQPKAGHSIQAHTNLFPGHAPLAPVVAFHGDISIVEDEIQDLSKIVRKRNWLKW